MDSKALLYIKTPQLIGIILGCTVFIITISVVFYLLYASGSLSKLFNELQSTQRTSSSILSKQTDINIISTQFLNQPQLYDELIHARNKLSSSLDISLQGINVSLRNINLLCDNEILSLIEISNGSALFGESSYDTDRLWGWFHNEYKCPKNHVYKYIRCPSNTINEFRNIFYNNEHNNNVTHLLIKEKILDKVIGMISLVNIQPKYLSIQIDNIWVTPAFQAKKRSHEAMYLIIEYLIKLGYRRIFVEIDERHIIGRKYLERCGFLLEGILRKHKIIQNRNSNTAIYVILNSDWIEVELKLKKYLNIKQHPRESKLAHIENVLTVIDNDKQNFSSQNKIIHNKKKKQKKK